MEDNGQDAGRLSRRERTRQQLEEEIISAATDLFARHGYEGSSMQMIAERAEISVGKLYLHFEGKQDIYRRAIEYHYAAIRERSRKAFDPSMPPLDGIRARARAVIDYVTENEGFVRFYIAEMQGAGSVCCHVDESEHAVHMAEFADLIREAIRRGDIPDEDPELLSALMHGAAHALMAAVVERGDIPLSVVIDYVDRIIIRPMEERMLDEKRKGGGA